MEEAPFNPFPLQILLVISILNSVSKKNQSLIKVKIEINKLIWSANLL